MAPKNRVSTTTRRRPEEDVVRPPDYAGEEQQSDGGTDSDSDSEGGAAEEGTTPLLSPKKPKFASPLKRPGPEPVENGSACSSPSASGFVVVPFQKPSGEKKMKTRKSSPLFSDDDVISLLKALAVFWADGKNSKWAEFHLFVKDDLGNQFTKTQLSEKIRSLKRKFKHNYERAHANGGRIDLSDPHESVVFELSKALWGDEIGIALEKGRENGDEEKVNEIVVEGEVVVEDDEGSKKKKKKRKQVSEGEESKNTRKQEHDGIEESAGEGDVHDAANTILSIRKLVDENGEGNKKLKLVDENGEGREKAKLVDENGEGNEKSRLDDEHDEGNKNSKLVNKNGEGNKKSRKKKRKQGYELDEKKEMQVEEYDEGNKISNNQKKINGCVERNKKMKKTKLVVECEANKIAGEEKEVDGHAAKGEISKEVNHNDEGEKLLIEGKKVENIIPRNRKKEMMEIGVDGFQSTYPLLYVSFNSEYPKAVMRNCVLIGRENAQELEEKWRKLKAQELRLELKRLDLMTGQEK